ncbi:hypothetical protein IAU59_000633 [Kwoniella sp. CBS 9459]
MVNPVSTGKMAVGPQENMQPAVLYKLIIFALLMAIVPIGTYFTVLNQFANGSTTVAAIAAVVAANIVLVSYVVVAFKEDAATSPTTPITPGGEVKKNR